MWSCLELAFLGPPLHPGHTCRTSNSPPPSFISRPSTAAQGPIPISLNGHSQIRVCRAWLHYMPVCRTGGAMPASRSGCRAGSRRGVINHHAPRAICISLLPLCCPTGGVRLYPKYHGQWGLDHQQHAVSDGTERLGPPPGSLHGLAPINPHGPGPGTGFGRIFTGLANELPRHVDGAGVASLFSLAV